jgi:membrane-associated phospholipid phosphatase
MSATVTRRAVAGCALAFVALAALVWRHPLLADDTRVDRRLLLAPGSMRWAAASALSFMASGPVVAAAGLVVAVWTARRLRRPAGALAIALAPAVAGVAEVAIKSLVGRPRPLTAALTGESGDGFPSGHVAGFTALVAAVVVVWLFDGGRTPVTTSSRFAALVVAGVTVAAVAWARVAVGAHYPTDTIGGAILGLAIGLGAPAACARAWTLWRGRRVT